MKKIFILLLFFLFLLFSPYIKAQEMSQRWVCLKAERLDVRKALISVDPDSKLLPNSNTYIFECFSPSECTSGTSELDQQVFGKDNLAEMKNKYEYNFEGSTLASNPIKSDNNGFIPSFTWQSSSIEHERRWLALNYFDPNSKIETGDEKSHQLGTFNLEEAVNNSKCVSISWDPYGVVFDSKTLEPIYNANVTLLKKRVNNNFTIVTPDDLLGGNIINPQQTKEDGRFSFVVPDGTYKLFVTHPYYNFPEKVINIHRNYSKIYSDIYPDNTGEEIIQAGKIQHRDIPLNPKSKSLSNEAKLMEYFYDLNKLDSKIYIKGRTSMPFVKIKAYSTKPDQKTNNIVRYRLLTKNPIISDKTGAFNLIIDQSKFEATEIFGDIVLEKTDLTGSLNFGEKIKNWFFGLINKVNAEVVLASSYRFEPILNYIEGYAYDSEKKIIPNAKVLVVLNFSNKPAYQTNADEKGYFKISSKFLPSMPYRLVFVDQLGKSIPTNTSKFIAQNQNLIKNSKININQFKEIKNESNAVISKSISPTTKDFFNQKNNNPNNLNANLTNQIQKTNQSNLNNNILALILTIIIFLIIGLIFVFIYFIKKTQR